MDCECSPLNVMFLYETYGKRAEQSLSRRKVAGSTEQSQHLPRVKCRDEEIILTGTFPEVIIQLKAFLGFLQMKRV